MKKSLSLLVPAVLIAIFAAALAGAGPAQAISSGCAAVDGYSSTFGPGLTNVGPYALAQGEVVVVTVSNIIAAPGSTVTVLANVSGIGPVAGQVFIAPGSITITVPFDLTVSFQVAGTFVSATVSVTCVSPDGRVFTGFADNEAVLYPAPGGGLHLYGVNEDGEGFYVFSITEADVAPWEGNPPAVNTLIKSSPDGYYSLYILTTGELQLNIGPDAEGKVRVIIFDDLRPDTIYGYVIDPNED